MSAETWVVTESHAWGDDKTQIKYLTPSDKEEIDRNTNNLWGEVKNINNNTNNIWSNVNGLKNELDALRNSVVHQDQLDSAVANAATEAFRRLLQEDLIPQFSELVRKQDELILQFSKLAKKQDMLKPQFSALARKQEEFIPQFSELVRKCEELQKRVEELSRKPQNVFQRLFAMVRRKIKPLFDKQQKTKKNK